MKRYDILSYYLYIISCAYIPIVDGITKVGSGPVLLTVGVETVFGTSVVGAGLVIVLGITRDGCSGVLNNWNAILV